MLEKLNVLVNLIKSVILVMERTLKLAKLNDCARNALADYAQGPERQWVNHRRVEENDHQSERCRAAPSGAIYR